VYLQTDILVYGCG